MIIIYKSLSLYVYNVLLSSLHNMKLESNMKKKRGALIRLIVANKLKQHSQL